MTTFECIPVISNRMPAHRQLPLSIVTNPQPSSASRCAGTIHTFSNRNRKQALLHERTTRFLKPRKVSESATLERIPLDVNQKSYTGFPWARKSDSYAPDGRSGGRRW